MTRILETVLTGRNLLSPVLAKAGRDVVAFNSAVAGANEKAAAGAATSARAQQAAATSSAAASGRAATASAAGAATQSGAADKIAASNVKASTSASASAQQQMRGHTQAAQSATLNARIQETANRSLAASNGLLGTSLTPLTAGLGGTALALGYAGYRGMEFGSAMSQVQAASQETGATLDQLRDAAVEAGAKTQYSAVEAAQGITEMSKAGVGAKDILGGGLTGALNLAAAGQISVADAAETGATALSVFNLKGDQMSHVADLLAAGAGKAQGSVGDLSAALNQSALVASQAGLSVEDTAGALAMFASNGLIGSDAGTSFKTMLQALTPNSVAASKAMDAIGFSAYDAQGRFVGMESVAGQLRTGLAGLTEEQRNTTLETIFGSDAVRAASVLYKEGAAGVAEWAGNVNDAGYAQRQAAQLTDNLRGDLEKLGGAFDSVMTTVGSGAQGALRDLVQMLTGLVNGVGWAIDAFGSLPGPLQTAIVAFGAMAALRGPVSGAFEKMTDSVLGWSLANDRATASAGAARAGLAGLLLAATELAVVATLSKAVTDVVEFTNAGDDAREMVKGLREGLRGLDGAAKLEANTAAIEQLRGEMERHQDVIDEYEDYNAVEWALWGQFAQGAGEVKNARESLELLQEEIARLEDGGGRSFFEIGSAVRAAMDTITGGVDGVGGAIEATVTQTEEAQKALEDWMEAAMNINAGFVDPLATYKGLLDEKTAAEREAAEKTAAATEDATGSWKDHVGEVDVSLDELADRFEQQLTDQMNWRTNLASIAQWAGADVAQYLFDMGEEGVDIVAKMADGSSAEAQRMAGLITEDIRRGGEEWSGVMGTEWKVLEAIGARGGKDTARSIANALGVGLADVARIARQYGIELANGVNPLLQALGKGRVRVPGVNGVGGGVTWEADGGVLNFYANGGLRENHVAQIAPAGAMRVWAEPETGGESYIPLAESKRGRSLDIWRETGKLLGAPEAQYFAFGGISDVPRPSSTAPYRAPISTAADAAMQKGFDEVRAWLEANAGGVAGSGAVGGAWSSLWNLVKGQIPQARINSTFRAGDPGYHGRGKAIDFGYGTGPGGAGSAGLASINRLLHDQVGRNLAELIYDGIGDDRPDLKNGRPLVYSASTRAQHTNHVHAAVADTGGVMASGTAHLNLSGRPERTLSPQQTEAFDRWMSAPAAMPGYGSAPVGGWGQGGTTKVTVSLQGASITGRLELGTDGLVTLVDGRITDVLTYAGTAAT